jgi:hypothetical protein
MKKYDGRPNDAEGCDWINMMARRVASSSNAMQTMRRVWVTEEVAVD